MDDRAIGDGVPPGRTVRPRPASTGRANRPFGLLYAVGMMIGGAFALGSGTADAARVCPSMTITVSADGLSDRIGCDVLDPLPMAEVTTDTPWTDGPSRFEGYPLYELLIALGLEGRDIEAAALNDYSATLCWDLIDTYRPVLATVQDGRPLSVRSRGPFWLVLPFDDHAELRNDMHFFKAVWQLDRIADRGSDC